MKCTTYECKHGKRCCFDCDEAEEYCNFRCEKYDYLEHAEDCEYAEEEEEDDVLETS